MRRATPSVPAPRRKAKESPAAGVPVVGTAFAESQPVPIRDVDLELEPSAEEQGGDKISEALVAAPPWLISLLVHLVGIVVLGILALPYLVNSEIRLDAVFSESIGEQLDTETFEVDSQQLDAEPLVTPSDLTFTEDPLASNPTDLLELHDQQIAATPFAAANVGLALSGREPGMKDTLLLAYGGDATTEAAVAEALKWLKRNQRSDGAWSLKGPYSNGSSINNRLAATSMALLAFQGAGFTHQSTRNMLDANGEKTEVDYRRVIRRAWDAMLKWQSKDGNFWKKSNVNHHNHVLYSQAQATIAICELYGMTKDDRFRRPAQRAVNYAVRIQDQDGMGADGGWRYQPGTDSDTSVTGWFVMALQSARMAGLDVPSDVFDKIAKYLDAVTEDGSYYSYTPDYGSKPSMTAEALLCRQYLGWPQDDPRLLKGVAYIAQYPVDWSEPNTYYWYYATQVMHHMEGDIWFDWNEVMAKELPAKQVKKGPERGSWDITDDTWGQGGGRLYMTCMCTFMLEVYYRHLPIYSDLY